MAVVQPKFIYKNRWRARFGLWVLQFWTDHDSFPDTEQIVASKKKKKNEEGIFAVKEKQSVAVGMTTSPKFKFIYF